MGRTITVKDFKGLWSGPFYKLQNGWLKTLQNATVRPGGFIEMRGGIETIRPSGGNNTAPLAAGEICLGVLGSYSPYGWVRSWNALAGRYTVTDNMAPLSDYPIFGASNVLTVGDAIWVGAEEDFSYVQFYVSFPMDGAATFAYEYTTGEGAPGVNPPVFAALTTTETPSWTSVGVKRLSFVKPADWVRATSGTEDSARGYVKKKWVRIRLTALGGATVTKCPIQGWQPLFVDWNGTRELFVWTGNPVTGGSATAGRMLQYQEYREAGGALGTTWTGLSTSLRVGYGRRVRSVSYRGYPYWVNGIESRKFGRSRSQVDTLGNPTPSGALTTTIRGAAAGTTRWVGDGAQKRYRYAVTYGYGPLQRRDGAVITVSNCSSLVEPGPVPPAGPTTLNTTSSFDGVKVGDYLWWYDDANALQKSTVVEVYSNTKLYLSSGPTATTNRTVVFVEGNIGYMPTLLGEGNEFVQTDNAPLYSVAPGDDRCVDVNLGALTIPSDVSAIYLYRTNDLANAVASAYDSYPMFLRATVTKQADATWPTVFSDFVAGFPAPLKPLDITDATPPEGARYIAVHKACLCLASSPLYPNRLWTSLPYQPDRFDRDGRFVELGAGSDEQFRGMIEYGDQLVCFTDDAMYGVSDVDTDNPQVVPMFDIGCVAPDATASGDGMLFVVSKDGVYAMSGNEPPVKISLPVQDSFKDMTYESHGGSYGTYHNRCYELRILSLDGQTRGTHWRYNVETGAWSTVVLASLGTTYPMASIKAPFGTAQSGREVPVYAQPYTASSELNLALGETGTADAGTGYSVIVDAYFGPDNYRAFSVTRMAAHYLAANGWAATPVLSSQNAAGIWVPITAGAMVTLAADTGTDYDMIDAVNKESQSGGQDIVMRFAVTSASGGTLYGQRLYAVHLEGSDVEPKRR